MLHRIVLVVVIVPVAIVLIALAVANRAPAAFTLDPFNPGNPGLTVELPLFVLLFLALLLGLLVGGLATWIGQGRYRREAREQRREVQTLIQEAGRRNVRPAAPSAQALPAPLP
jgi:uncharacterized integral membrane protein